MSVHAGHLAVADVAATRGLRPGGLRRTRAGTVAARDRGGGFGRTNRRLCEEVGDGEARPSAACGDSGGALGVPGAARFSDFVCSRTLR